MRFAPQRRDIFGHWNFEKCSRPGVVWAFSLANVLRATVFGHWNFKNCSNSEVFWAFSLAKALRATAPCHFWTLELQKMLRTWGGLGIFTCKCASRHSAVPFLDIGTSKNAPEPEVVWAFSLANVLRATAACHFSFLCWTATSAPAALASLLFEHPEPPNIEKSQRFVTSVTFGACVSSFWWLNVRVDLLSSYLTSLACFSTVHIVGN